MQTTQTWGDILIQLVIFFGGSFVLFLLTRYVFPWLRDWWARRSIRRRARQLAVLTEALDEYEKDFADTKRFIARLLLKGVSAIIGFLTAMMMLLLSFHYLTFSYLDCMIENTCRDFNNWSSVFQHHALMRSAVFMILCFVCQALFFIAFTALYSESAPERYRKRIGNRIARLRDEPPPSNGSPTDP